MRRLTRLCTATLGIALAVALAVDIPFVVDSPGGQWQLCAVLTALVIGIGWAHTYFFHLQETAKDTEQMFPFRQVAPGKVLMLQRLAAQQWAGEDRKALIMQAKAFTFAVCNPNQWRRRTTEEYTPSRQTLTQKVTVDVQMPKRFWSNGENEVTYLPVLLPTKGELHDDFRIGEAGGAGLSPLTYRESLTMIAATLRVLLATALDLQSGQRLSDEAMIAESIVLTAIMQRRDPNSSAPVPDPAAADVITTLKPHRDLALELVAQFARTLIEKYAIVVAVPLSSDRRFKFEYHQTLVPETKFGLSDSGHRRTFGGFLRILLGARPVELTLDIANASTSQSFHLHVHAPDGLYLAHQETFDMAGPLNRLAPDAPTLPHCRFRRRLGQPHAHFYARYMPTLEEGEKPLIRFKFYEVPPGAALRAAITTLACLAIVWMVAIINSHYQDPGSDVAAWLLAFPAAAATWLGFDAPTQRLLDGTMSSRLLLILTAVISIAASGVFMWHKSAPGGQYFPTLPAEWTVLGVDDVYWAVLVTLSIVIAAIAGYKCVLRSWEYLKLMTRVNR